MHPNPFKVYEYYELVSQSNLKADHKVIDLGSGLGYYTLLLAEKCDCVVGIEPLKEAVEYARRFRIRNNRGQVRFIPSVLEQANLPANSFDRIYSFCVLEHINNLETVLSEAYAVLKPGGEMHVSLDSLGNMPDEELIAKHRRDHGVHQYFTPTSARQIFESRGFEVMQVLPIMTGNFAASEFAKRVQRSFRYGLLRRLLTFSRFQYNDRNNPGETGIMIIVRARRPVG